MKDKNRIGSSLKCSVAGEIYYSYLPKALPPDPLLVLDKIYPLIAVSKFIF
jgi:hypothetical protein